MRWTNGITIVGLLAIFILGGCDWNTSSSTGPEATNDTRTNGGQTYLNKTAIRNETGNQTNTAVDAAMEWARKYSEVSAKREQLLHENRLLRQKQLTHQQQVTKLNSAERELAQANSMLLEMKAGLEKWKTNVLGFRNEMRQSQKAQLDALVRILTLIGGEVVEKPSAIKPATKTTDSKEEKTGGAT